MAHAGNPITQEGEVQDHCEIEASLGYTAKLLCQKKKKKEGNKILFIFIELSNYLGANIPWGKLYAVLEDLMVLVFQGLSIHVTTTGKNLPMFIIMNNELEYFLVHLCHQDTIKLSSVICSLVQCRTSYHLPL